MAWVTTMPQKYSDPKGFEFNVLKIIPCLMLSNLNQPTHHCKPSKAHQSTMKG
jgi:hypothetical protein